MLSGVRDDLPSDMVVQYNGLQLPSNVLIVGFQTKGVPDRAGRTFVGLRHSLTVKFWLNAQTDGDPDETLDIWQSGTMPSIRQTLMKPGCQLVLANTTWGNITVNGNQPGNQDLAWGPVPEDFSWKPYYKYGAECTWRVSWMLNACANQLQETPILEWCYGLGFAIDELGYTTRTYEGQVATPVLRGGDGRSLEGSVDLLREQIVPPLPVGFRRQSQSFRLSDDKRTLHFRIVDKQMPPNIPPPGVIKAEASHTTRNSKKGFWTWTNTLRARYELANNVNGAYAWQCFTALYQQRTQAAKGQLIIPLELTLSEPEIYGGNVAEISLTYTMTPPKTQLAAIDKDLSSGTAAQKRAAFIPTTIISSSGLWTPVNASWVAWAQSMQQAQVSLPRGYAGLTFLPSDDVIIDLCGGALPTAQNAVQAWQARQVAAGPFTLTATPQNSYLDYQMGIDVIAEDGTSVLRTLPASAGQLQYAPANQSNSSTTGGYQQPYTAAPNALGQFRAAPRYRLVLWGRAVRIGFDIPAPQVIELAGQQPIPCNDETCGFRSWVDNNYLCPVIRAEWRFQYALLQPPQQPITAPSNPLLGGTTADKSETRQLKGGVAKG